MLACCRCMWPILGGGSAADRPFPKAPCPSDKEHEHATEEDCLLGNVIDSDDEQADPLSPDQIKRYIETSKMRAELGADDDDHDEHEGIARCRYNSTSRSKGSSLPREKNVPMVSGSHLNRDKGGSVPSGRPSAPSLMDEGDDLFDEELAEPDDVVMGAKPWILPSKDGSSSKGLRSSPSSFGSHPPSQFGTSQHSGIPPSSSGGVGLRSGAELSDWIDEVDEVGPALPMKVNADSAEASPKTSHAHAAPQQNSSLGATFTSHSVVGSGGLGDDDDEDFFDISGGHAMGAARKMDFGTVGENEDLLGDPSPCQGHKKDDFDDFDLDAELSFSKPQNGTSPSAGRFASGEPTDDD